MIGPRAYPAIGLFASLATGVGVDEIGSSTVPAATTLTASLTDSADPVITSVAFSYSFVVTNTGAISATTVAASVLLDASLTYVSASGTGWTVDTSALPTVSFSRAAGAVGALPTITINVTSGGAAVTASSTGNASASNAPSATPSVQTTVVKLVSKDATSGIRVPASSTEWTDFIAYNALGIATPDSLWLCQEASGNAADSIGSLTLTAVSAPTYSQVVSGWTRLGFAFTGAASSGFRAAVGVGPNPSTTSSLWIFVGVVTAIPGADKQLLSAGGGALTTDCSILVKLTTGLPESRCVNVVTSGVGSSMLNVVQPFVVQYNRTGAVAQVMTGQERVVGTYNSGVTDGAKGIGGLLSQTAASKWIYGVMLSGTNSELSSAQIKSLLLALGWAIPWS